MSARLTTVQVAEMLTATRHLRERFAHTAPQPWTPATASAELCVQLGHLAICILRHDEVCIADLEDPQRPITDVGDELADVVLAALSVCTLAHVEPAPIHHRREQRRGLSELVQRLVVSAGALAEAAMVHTGHRHVPTGRPPAIPLAAAQVIEGCAAIAVHLDLDLVPAFNHMVRDATAFLDQRVGPA